MRTRLLTPEDRPFVEKCIAGEPSHTANTWEWYNSPGTKSVIVEDSEGPILVAKFTPCLRMDTDFNLPAGPSRIGKAIAAGLAEMEPQARAQGFREIVYDSVDEKLNAFNERLGYRKSPDWRKVL
jgi:hypothetical protein